MNDDPRPTGDVGASSHDVFGVAIADPFPNEIAGGGYSVGKRGVVVAGMAGALPGRSLENCAHVNNQRNLQGCDCERDEKSANEDEFGGGISAGR